jgi:hypothetical protein
MRRCARAVVRTLTTGLVGAIACTAPAYAQDRPPAAPAPRTTMPAPAGGQSRWEIEGYGGFSAGRIPASGSPSLPPTGQPILTSSPVYPSRAVSSWWFGDGAALLNGVNADFGIPNRITPLDAAFSALPSGRGAAFGVRVRRTLTRRLSAELSLDTMLGAAGHAAGLDGAANAARASFVDAFQALLATGPFSAVAVDATATTTGGSGRDVAITGAVNVRFAKRGPFVPYVTAGAGVLRSAGQLPSATLQGHYAFRILGDVPIDETDRVMVRYVHQAALVGVFGGGVRRDLSGAWGLRIDARVFVGSNGTRLLLEAAPSGVQGTPADFIESFTNPAIQFSNNASTGRHSSLSGPALSDFAAFTGTGVFTRVLVTVGIVRTF